MCSSDSGSLIKLRSNCPELQSSENWTGARGSASKVARYYG